MIMRRLGRGPQAIEMRATVRIAWWWRWLYWPLTVAGMRLGVPISIDVVAADFRRAVTVKIEQVRRGI